MKRRIIACVLCVMAAVFIILAARFSEWYLIATVGLILAAVIVDEDT